MLYTNTHICVLHNKRIMIYQCHDCMLSLILIVAQNSPPLKSTLFQKKALPRWKIQSDGKKGAQCVALFLHGNSRLS